LRSNSYIIIEEVLSHPFAINIEYQNENKALLIRLGLAGSRSIAIVCSVLGHGE
jgi:hypothetical protein